MNKLMLSIFLLSIFAGNVLADSETLQGQKLLSIRGYDVGKPDGIFGARTSAAIKKFQRDKGIPITGAFDIKTKSALGIKSEKRKSATQHYPSKKTRNRTIGMPIRSPTMKCPVCEVMVNGRWQCKTQAEAVKYSGAPTLCKSN